MDKIKVRTPMGVKGISVLFYVFSVLQAVMSVLTLVSASRISSAVGQQLSSIVYKSIIVLGIIMLISAAVMFFVGMGLWEGKRWSRIGAIVYAILFTVSSILGLAKVVVLGSAVSLFIMLIISTVILAYLLFNKSVKSAFA